MEPILDLSPDQFRAALAELGLDPEREAFLIDAYNQQNAPQQGAGGRGMMYNLLDNIIGYDDDVVTPGERLGAGVQGFASGLLSDPLGTGADIVRGGYETIERAMAPGATPMDVLGAAGMAMGAGGMAAAPRGALRSGFAGDDYRGVHRAPGFTDDGSTASLDSLNTIYPDDIYDRRVAARYYGHMEDPIADQEMIDLFSRIRGRPDVGVPVYRAVPVDAPDEINAGDWVTPSRRYAEGHGESALGGEYKIISSNVPARELFTDANSIFEFGWSPSTLAANRSTTTGLLASAASETPAQQVARLLREGRADEVTDDLMAQADPQEMFRLYEAGETGADMPMDEASRMARAQEMGFNTAAYRGTLSDEITARPQQFVSENPDVTQSFAGHISFADEIGLPAELAQAEGGNIMPLLVNPQSNASSLTNYEMLLPGQSIRSRFARFDPRLSHLANLNAANVDPLTGAVAMGASQQQNTDPLANLRAYITQYGGVLGR